MEKILISYFGILNYSYIPNYGYRLVIDIDPEFGKYYRALIPKWFKVNKPKWPIHITIVRGIYEQPNNLNNWNKYQGQEIKFKYEPIIYMDKKYYWLNIWCIELENIREELGLPNISKWTLPPSGFKKCFHMTIANKK